jgi:hypothetical protein
MVITRRALRGSQPGLWSVPWYNMSNEATCPLFAAIVHLLNPWCLFVLRLMVKGLPLSSAFLTNGNSKRLQYCLIFTHSSTGLLCQPSKAVMVRRLAQGHLDIRQGGAGDRTSNLTVTSQPALPPEPHTAASTQLK